ncbi:site-specific recombinase, phage integrase family [Ancylostoma duodenale]|uniref:Site-specific recombinase, phage integrase family n=1 Tax=Ancylostoma duodenale TaxID=51022 RepID=A0A0C2GBY5_9BILA|nr:site-specific recombinase, phage integrase family [Ancylostoma duodenale]
MQNRTLKTYEGHKEPFSRDPLHWSWRCLVGTVPKFEFEADSPHQELRDHHVRQLQDLAVEMKEEVHEVLGNLLAASRAPNTIKAYERAISDFRAWQLQGPQARRRNDLDSVAIYLAKKSQTVSHQSLATFVAALAYHRMGRKPEEATRWKILDEIVKGSRRTVLTRAQNFASSEEWLQLLGVADQMPWMEWKIHRAQILLTFLFCALMRISEAVEVRARDVTEQPECWRIEITRSRVDQNQRGTAVFLAKETWLDAAMRQRLQAGPDVHVLASKNGSKWSANAATAEIKRMCDAAGLRRLSPHSFRRGGTMRALDEGIDPIAVQHRGRWASTRSMRPYVVQSIHTQGEPAHITEQ